MLHSCGHTHLHRHYRDHDAPSAGGAGREMKSALATPSHTEIAALAYSYWEARGRQGGSHCEDWFRAERELRRQK
ncbi:MAG: DUF2934 domain-containing protein [Bryobacteraceae bacterium]